MEEILTEHVPTMQERLLNAAEQIVARDGVGNLTLEAVAREAGVSKGGLLYHYPSKSALITGVVERMCSHCEFEQGKVLEGDHETPGAFTRAYLNARLEPMDPEAKLIHTALLAAAGTDPQYLAPIRERITQWQQRLENDGIDPVDAMIVRLATDGLCLCDLLNLPIPEGELRRGVVERLQAITHNKSKSGNSK